MRIRRLAVIVAAVAQAAACAEPPGLTAPDSPVLRIPAPLASVVSKVPQEDPGAPFYAISGNGGFLPHDGEWAAIPFHRALGCVPASANLLTIDVPAAFSCALTVEGHVHWENGPGIDLAPRQTQLSGVSVPIVFVRWAVLQPAASDGILTRPELLGLPTAIVGTASHYVETDIFGISGPLGAGRGMYKITARGTLPGGGSFSLHINEVLGELRVVQIRFAP